MQPSPVHALDMIRERWKSLEANLFEDASTGGSKFSALDGLRGIAVLVVFFSHSSGFHQRWLPWLDFRSTGHLGVYLFFVLSGFMLAYSLLGRQKTPFLRFYERRFWRIAPLFYLVVSLTFAVQLIFQVPHFAWLQVNDGWSGFIRHILFLQGNSVFWTIAVEFEFYIILPFIIILLQRFDRQAAWFFFALLLAYGSWATAIDLGWIDPRYALRIANVAHHSQYLDVFLCGVLGAFVARKPGWGEFATRHATAIGWTGCFIALITVAASLIFVAKRFAVFNGEWNDLRHFSFLYGLAFTAIAMAACYGKSLPAKLLDNKWLRIIGITCFSWYLLHFIVINTINHLFGYSWSPAKVNAPWEAIEPLRLALSFGVTFFVAIASYLWIEKPFMIFSRNLLRSPNRVATAPF